MENVWDGSFGRTGADKWRRVFVDSLVSHTYDYMLNSGYAKCQEGLRSRAHRWSTKMKQNHTGKGRKTFGTLQSVRESNFFFGIVTDLVSSFSGSTGRIGTLMKKFS